MINGVYAGYGKRLFDFTAALVLMILLIPALLVVAFLVRLLLGRPVIFSQQRPGLNGEPFILFKFRTMTHRMGPDGRFLPDAIRLTSFGKFLRRASLDELPELFNVLRGDMSLVGPRPLLMEYLPLYSPDQNRRLQVRPGVTGLAQVMGRNALSWEAKFRYDTEYVDNLSLGMDLRILARTVLAVLTSRGITQDGSATAEKFTGSRH